MYICFNDVRDAAAAFEQIQKIDPTIIVVYITQTEFANAKENGTEEPTSFNDGQVLWIANYLGKSKTAESPAADIFDAIVKEARGFGDIRSVAEVGAQSGCLEFRMEFYRINEAKGLVAILGVGVIALSPVSYSMPPQKMLLANGIAELVSHRAGIA